LNLEGTSAIHVVSMLLTSWAMDWRFNNSYDSNNDPHISRRVQWDSGEERIGSEKDRYSPILGN